MIRESLAFILALSLTSLALAPVAAARERTAAYTTGADVLASCSDDPLGSLVGGNYGSACFEVRDGESSVDVAIEDLYLDGVGGAIDFQDADGGSVGELVPFCSSIEDVSIPGDAERIEVVVNGPTFQALDCQGLSTSTFGDIVVDFS